MYVFIYFTAVRSAHVRFHTCGVHRTSAGVLLILQKVRRKKATTHEQLIFDQRALILNASIIHPFSKPFVPSGVRRGPGASLPASTSGG